MPASTAFYPGPDEVRLTYTVAGRTHVQRLNTNVNGTPPYDPAFANIDVFIKGGGVVDLATAVDDWVTLIKPLFYSVNATFDFAELWHYETDSYIAAFQTNYAISVAGTNGSAGVNAGQAGHTPNCR